MEIQLEIQPLAPDLGRRAVASGSKKRVIYPSKMTFFSLGTYGKMMINHGMDCGAFFLTRHGTPILITETDVSQI